MNQRRVVRLEQGSEEWYQHRLLHRNASETAAVMGLCPWLTKYQLWEIKTGRRRPEATFPMKRGTELEPLARRAYEEDTGLIVEPVVMVSGAYSASLDGISFDGKTILEVKVPMHGRESETWKAASDFRVPDHYFLQVQHQLMVSGAESCDFYVWDGERMGIVLQVTPDKDVQSNVQAAWDTFWDEYIVKDVPPPLSERDCVYREDLVWRDAAAAYLAAKVNAEAACTQAERAKAALVNLASHNSEKGCGVSVTRFWKGSKEEVRVTVMKQELA